MRRIVGMVLLFSSSGTAIGLVLAVMGPGFLCVLLAVSLLGTGIVVGTILMLPSAEDHEPRPARPAVARGSSTVGDGLLVVLVFMVGFWCAVFSSHAQELGWILLDRIRIGIERPVPPPSPVLMFPSEPRILPPPPPGPA